jgi:hypothetical protein
MGRSPAFPVGKQQIKRAKKKRLTPPVLWILFRFLKCKANADVRRLQSRFGQVDHL